MKPLNRTQTDILIILYFYKIAYPRDLIILTGNTKSYIHRCLDSLVEDGYIGIRETGYRSYYGILQKGINYLAKKEEFPRKDVSDVYRMLNSSKDYARHEALITQVRALYKKESKQIPVYGRGEIEAILSPAVLKNRGIEKIRPIQVRTPLAWGLMRPYEFDDVLLVDGVRPEIHCTEVTRVKKSIRSKYGELAPGTTVKKFKVFINALERGYFDRTFGTEFAPFLRVVIADYAFSASHKHSLKNAFHEMSGGHHMEKLHISTIEELEKNTNIELAQAEHTLVVA